MLSTSICFFQSPLTTPAQKLMCVALALTGITIIPVTVRKAAIYINDHFRLTDTNIYKSCEQFLLREKNHYMAKIMSIPRIPLTTPKDRLRSNMLWMTLGSMYNISCTYGLYKITRMTFVDFCRMSRCCDITFVTCTYVFCAYMLGWCIRTASNLVIEEYKEYSDKRCF